MHQRRADYPRHTWFARTRGPGIAWAWLFALLLATLTAVFAAAEPLMQVTDCEVWNASDPDCKGSVLDFYGGYFLVRASVPPLACVLALGIRTPAFSVIACLVIGSSILIASFMLYFLPVLLVAACLAGYQVVVSH
ncbi:hypothetical protein UG54_05440 [Gordonia sihwensis]|nr:hypothetical protein UG54_05440 [Gordonia sihwensis]